jgi:hypothetical protein
MTILEDLQQAIIGISAASAKCTADVSAKSAFGELIYFDVPILGIGLNGVSEVGVNSTNGGCPDCVDSSERAPGHIASEWSVIRK